MRIIEGKNPVIEALKSDVNIEKIMVSREHAQGVTNKIIKLAKEKNIIIKYVEKNMLNKISQNGRHQGVIAQAAEFEYKTVDDIFEKAKKRQEKPFIIILDEITDVHNFGAIIRTAECAGAHGIIIPKRRSAGVNEIVSKTSAGAVEYMPIVKVTNINNIIEELKKRGLWIFGADMEGEKYYFEENLKTSLAIVIGSEGKGISRLVKENCDTIVKIPMYGRISSLNASCAASIIIYDVIRQREY